jgi:hypothetical protein
MGYGKIFLVTGYMKPDWPSLLTAPKNAPKRMRPTLLFLFLVTWATFFCWFLFFGNVTLITSAAATPSGKVRGFSMINTLRRGTENMTYKLLNPEKHRKITPKIPPTAAIKVVSK